MKIVTPINIIPDLVEELTINESGKALDMTWINLILNEFDDHALEQAILLKEKSGGEVIVLAQGVSGADDVLYTAAAKDADRLVKLTVLSEELMNNHAFACIIAPLIKEMKPDLVLTGVQAHNDIDGQLGPILAEYLHFPYIGCVSDVVENGGKVLVQKEYPGGLIARLEATLPAVLGIQSAEMPPRYVAFSKVRQVRNTAIIEEISVSDINLSGGPIISKMYQPEIAERAEMLEGGVEEIAEKLIEIMSQAGVL